MEELHRWIYQGIDTPLIEEKYLLQDKSLSKQYVDELLKAYKPSSGLLGKDWTRITSRYIPFKFLKKIYLAPFFWFFNFDHIFSYEKNKKIFATWREEDMEEYRRITELIYTRCTKFSIKEYLNLTKEVSFLAFVPPSQWDAFDLISSPDVSIKVAKEIATYFGSKELFRTLFSRGIDAVRFIDKEWILEITDAFFEYYTEEAAEPGEQILTAANLAYAMRDPNFDFERYTLDRPHIELTEDMIILEMIYAMRHPFVAYDISPGKISTNFGRLLSFVFYITHRQEFRDACVRYDAHSAEELGRKYWLDKNRKRLSFEAQLSYYIPMDEVLKEEKVDYYSLSMFPIRTATAIRRYIKVELEVSPKLDKLFSQLTSEGSAITSFILAPFADVSLHIGMYGRYWVNSSMVSIEEYLFYPHNHGKKIVQSVFEGDYLDIHVSPEELEELFLDGKLITDDFISTLLFKGTHKVQRFFFRNPRKYEGAEESGFYADTLLPGGWAKLYEWAYQEGQEHIAHELLSKGMKYTRKEALDLASDPKSLHPLMNLTPILSEVPQNVLIRYPVLARIQAIIALCDVIGDEPTLENAKRIFRMMGVDCLFIRDGERSGYHVCNDQIEGGYTSFEDFVFLMEQGNTITYVVV